MAPVDRTGPVPEGRDPEQYDRARRRVMWSLPTGLYVVGSRSGDRWNLMTCSWLMQVATSPKLVAVAVERTALTLRLVEESGWFTVSVLARDDRGLVRRFVKPAEDVVVDEHGRAVSIEGTPVRETVGGVPRLEAALAWLACSVRTSVPERGSDRLEPEGGPVSHRVVVGEVVDVGGPVAEEPGDRNRPEVLRMEDTRLNYGG